MKQTLLSVAVLALLASTTTGCATKKYVQTETQAVQSRVDEVQGQVEENQTRMDEQDREIDRVDENAQQASRTAQEALQRAEEAGKLAEGKFLYETVLTDDEVKFPVDKSSLSPEARSALDAFASQLTGDNRNVYVEIQGHTDSTGSESYNETLGLDRAEAVRNYLNRQHKFPLHRMNVISYGEAAPIADNGSRAGRSQNRRVSLVVLQ
jgi:peptidoglycan-associated lipoprotein